ncbi:MAG: hypothetical protein HY381_01705 [Candidatus Chisholmbacteria bacterium]|nr:hypothetical protein [Candidatus Chisholmbacteria bacterium]
MMKLMQDKNDKLIPVLVKAVRDLSRKVDAGFEQVDKRFEQVDKRFEQVDQRFEQVDQRMATKEDLNDLEAKIIQRIEESEAMTGRGFVAVQEQIYQLATKAELAKVASDVRDIKRRLIDVETDTPTRQEFEELKRAVAS